MPKFEIKMPKLGESITEGTIVSWSVKVGDDVREDDVLFEVSTAKVSAEVPSPVAGKVLEILYQEGDTVPVGMVVAMLDLQEEGEDEDTVPAQETGSDIPDKASSNSMPSASATEKELPETAAAEATPAPESRWYSPVVLQLAKEAGIGGDELDKLPGTGFEGRLSKKDIQLYIDRKKRKNTETAVTGKDQPDAAPKKPAPEPPQVAPAPRQAASQVQATSAEGAKPAAATASQASGKASSITAGEGEEVHDMDRIRRIIADRMVESKKTSPHVTTFVEADVTRLVQWRSRMKDAFLQQEGIALTYMPAITEAAARALREFPELNASVNGYQVIVKKHIHIGIAVSLPDGNLIVPVIHDADRLNLKGLAAQIDRLADKARHNKLSPAEMSGGTFTITNFGSFKNLFATPIINQPEVAILGVGYIEKKPAVVETPEGDTIAIRNKMYLSLSYDHRIVDGALGGAFLNRIAGFLENWNEQA